MPVWYEGKEPKYVGAVIEDREKNGYHDSDFYVVAWDDEKGAIVTETYNTTRFAGGGGAAVDVTDETWAKVGNYARDYLLDAVANDIVAEHINAADRPSKGKMVRVAKGRKVKPGTEGKVFWIGEKRHHSHYTYSIPVGIALDDETETVEKTGRKGKKYTVERNKNVAWVADIKNLEVINPDSYLYSGADMAKALKTIMAMDDKRAYWAYRSHINSIIYRAGSGWAYVA